ncbi:hypothetical protein KEJ34_03580 [Candidatus Bathyarchaeota archaeon]|nr:hypothetical protein [Candidatus Bathyarchaeota archaeon]
MLLTVLMQISLTKMDAMIKICLFSSGKSFYCFQSVYNLGLGNLRDPAAIPALAQALKHRRSTVVRCMQHGL